MLKFFVRYRSIVVYFCNYSFNELYIRINRLNIRFFPRIVKLFVPISGLCKLSLLSEHFFKLNLSLIKHYSLLMSNSLLLLSFLFFNLTLLFSRINHLARLAPFLSNFRSECDVPYVFTVAGYYEDCSVFLLAHFKSPFLFNAGLL